MLEFIALATGIAATAFLLGPEYREIFRASPDSPPAETTFDYRADSMGVIVPKGKGAQHDLWVRIGGELWKARAVGPQPPPGSRVEVLSWDGSLVSVRLASPEAGTPTQRVAPYLTLERKYGFALWAVSALACWGAFGSPMYSIVGVPVLWLFAFALVSSFDLA